MSKEITTRQDLIEEAKKIEPTEKRIEFIMGYFKDNLKYNYMVLLFDISIKRNIRVNGDSIQPEPGSFMDIAMQLCHTYSEDYQGFISELKLATKEELKKYIQDEGEIERNSDKFIDFVEEHIGTADTAEKKVPDKLHFFGQLGLHSFNFDSIIDENGILREGVCQDFSDYLVAIMREAGIEDVHTISDLSPSNVEHTWMVAKIGDSFKTMDMNAITSIRDKKTGLDSELTMEDWMHMDLGDLFIHSPHCIITNIDGIRLSEQITADNYTPEFFEQQFDIAIHSPEIHSSQNDSSVQTLSSNKDSKSLTSYAVKALRIGITQEDSTNAEMHIKSTIKEKDTNEKLY